MKINVKDWDDRTFAKLRKTYEFMCDEMKKYAKNEDGAPQAMRLKYACAIADYRNFLNAYGLYMPLPIWQYKDDDRKTWLFIDLNLGVDKAGNKILKRAILNSEFAFYDRRARAGN